MTLGLVADNSEWHDALFEASTWKTGAQLRSVLCSLLIYSEMGQPKLIWDNHWEDLERRLHCEQQNPELRLTVDQKKNLCLYELELIMCKNDRSLKDYPPMPLSSSDMLL